MYKVKELVDDVMVIGDVVTIDSMDVIRFSVSTSDSKWLQDNITKLGYEVEDLARFTIKSDDNVYEQIDVYTVDGDMVYEFAKVENGYVLSDEAIDLIDEFFTNEYNHSFEFRGSRIIHLAYTEDDEGLPIQSLIDLKDISLVTTVNNEEVERITFNNERDMVDRLLMNLDFDELVSKWIA